MRVVTNLNEKCIVKKEDVPPQRDAICDFIQGLSELEDLEVDVRLLPINSNVRLP